MKWYLEVLKKYAVFSGRARRKEYWMFVFFNTVIYSILIMLIFILNVNIKDSMLTMHHPPSFWRLWPVAGLYLYFFATIIPGMAVVVRRLHDTNRSGWWILYSLVPFLGLIIVIVFMLQNSHSGDNQYGNNPKNVDMH